MKFKLLAIISLLILSSAVTAKPTLDGNTISWPDDGWYQVQRLNDDKVSVTTIADCNGKRLCAGLSSGVYHVINHTTGERFPPFVVAIAELPVTSVTVKGNVIRWPNNGDWYQVQDKDYNHICNGGQSCRVEDGTYLVTNHTTGVKTPNVVVPPAASGDTGNPGFEITVTGDVISWPDTGDWYQLQNANTYLKVCQGFINSCKVNPGFYQVRNHTKGLYYRDIEVREEEIKLVAALGLATSTMDTMDLFNDFAGLVHLKTLNGTIQNGMMLGLPQGTYYGNGERYPCPGGGTLTTTGRDRDGYYKYSYRKCGNGRVEIDGNVLAITRNSMYSKFTELKIMLRTFGTLKNMKTGELFTNKQIKNSSSMSVSSHYKSLYDTPGYSLTAPLSFVYYRIDGVTIKNDENEQYFIDSMASDFRPNSDTGNKRLYLEMNGSSTPSFEFETLQIWSDFTATGWNPNPYLRATTREIEGSNIKSLISVTVDLKWRAGSIFAYNRIRNSGNVQGLLQYFTNDDTFGRDRGTMTWEPAIDVIDRIELH